MTAHVDLAQLNRDNFASVITPVAKQQTSREIVFYDFADTLCELLASEVAKFTADTGIPVKHVCVEGDAATQQFIAAKQANSASPADVFFGPNNNMRALTKRGSFANIPLVDLLPNAAKLEENAARRSRRFRAWRHVVPFHRNQTVLAYNSAEVKDCRIHSRRVRPGEAEGHQDRHYQSDRRRFRLGISRDGNAGTGTDCKDDLYNFNLTKDEAQAVAEKCMKPVIEFFKAAKPMIEFTNGNEASIQRSPTMWRRSQPCGRTISIRLQARASFRRPFVRSAPRPARSATATGCSFQPRRHRFA